MCRQSFIFFFFNDTATTEIYTLSLHDALPIFPFLAPSRVAGCRRFVSGSLHDLRPYVIGHRSEEHTSELQSRSDLVCRLLLEKKKRKMASRILPASSLLFDLSRTTYSRNSSYT